MRLQIAALPQRPTDTEGGWRIPFIIVLDQVTDELLEQFEEHRAAWQGDVRNATGAEGLLCFEERVDVVPAWGDTVVDLASLDTLDEAVQDVVGPRGE